MKKNPVKKRILIIILLFIILAAAALSVSGKTSRVKYFSKKSGVDFSGGKVLEQRDTHGGFLGDGDTFIKIKFKDDSLASVLEAADHWHKLPLSEGLNNFVDRLGFQVFDIPEIKSGYYWFYDNHSQSSDCYDDTDLMKRVSWNFSFAIYDQEERVLYLCKFDT